MFPKPGLTKLDLARHYERVGGLMKPLLRERPLTFQVFPDGIESDGYYMKSVPRHFPDWIGTTKVAKRGGSLTQVVAADSATLVYLAGQNMVTPHAWLSRADKPREPDRLIVDFDPSPGAGFAAVRAAGFVGQPLDDCLGHPAVAARYRDPRDDLRAVDRRLSHRRHAWHAG